MATFVRNRVLNQLVWSAEEERQRVQRRETLLTQLEEVNLRGGPIPTRVLVALRRRGVTFRPRTSAAELIEGVFLVQERFMRQPDGLHRDAVSAASELSRRLAS
jgi:hypothetical protein